MTSRNAGRTASAARGGKGEVGLPACLFQYVEFCLFNLHGHILMLSSRKKELEDMVIYTGPLENAGEDNVGLVDGGRLPVPAAQRLLEMQDLDEDIRVLRKRIDPLISFIHTLGGEVEVSEKDLILHYDKDCDYDLLEILEKYYFVKRRPRWNEIEEIFHYSAVTFQTRRKELVKSAARWLCGGMVKGA